MANKLRFNPGFQTDDEAVSNYVVRRAELAQTLDALSPISASPPRVLITAPRGAGKTTLCRRVLAETRRPGSAVSAWQAIFLGEESYSVTTPGEFFLECLFQLADQTTDAGLKEAHDQAIRAQDEGVLLAFCLQSLQTYARAIEKRLLVIVENFHVILHDQIGDKAPELLDALREEELFGVLATSVAQSSAEDHGELPDDYIRIDLDPLDLPECQTLWESLTGAKVSSDRIRPLQILTGGSPRLLHILAEFMKTPSLEDLLGNLNLLIDQNTEYFKSQLDALPAMERKVFAALLDAWDPKTAKQIAEVARMTTNTTSAMLSRLSERGSVIKATGSGRSAIYYAAERLFNIYYLMRRRSHPSSRVRALVSFMTEYYENDELVDTTAKLVKEACAIAPERRADYHSTYSQIMSRASESVRRLILANTPLEFARSYQEDRLVGPLEQSNATLSSESSASDEIAELQARVDAAIETDNYELAQELLERLVEVRPSSAAWSRLAYLRQFDQDYPAAVDAARRAVELEPNDARLLALLGASLRRAERPSEALERLNEALKIDLVQPIALVELSNYWQQKGNTETALSLLEDAACVMPLPDKAESQRAMLLLYQHERERAEGLLWTKAKENADNYESRRLLATLLDNDGKTDDAVKLLMTAAKHYNSWERWSDAGTFLLNQTDRDGEAAEAFRTALSLGGNEIHVYRNLAIAMSHAGEAPGEIERVRDTMLERFQQVPRAWAAASTIDSHLGNQERAEADLRKAVDLGGNDVIRRQLSRLLSRTPSRRDEAESILREIAANSTRCSAAHDLAEFLVHNGRDSEAEKITAKVTASDDCYCCLVLHGQICERRGDKDQAEKTFRTALDLVEDGVPALIGLSNLVPAEEATALIERAVESDPSDPSCLLARAKLGHVDLETRQQYASEAITAAPNFMEGYLFLARTEALLGEVDDAIDTLETALALLPEQMEHIPGFVAAAMAVSEHLSDDRLEQRLAAQPNAASVEPLLVALRLKRGANPLVAKEVLEVAKDIVSKHVQKASL